MERAPMERRDALMLRRASNKEVLAVKSKGSSLGMGCAKQWERGPGKARYALQSLERKGTFTRQCGPARQQVPPRSQTADSSVPIGQDSVEATEGPEPNASVYLCVKNVGYLLPTKAQDHNCRPKCTTPLRASASGQAPTGWRCKVSESAPKVIRDENERGARDPLLLSPSWTLDPRFQSMYSTY
ncbi:hypothetical protein BGZ63DRAFT_443037 [Mariannaea sp. PMI_226]|nr:hypothetical protein BGZ63DRAFT_443037 [Mariannaea sp. PMI_226]